MNIARTLTAASFLFTLLAPAAAQTPAPTAPITPLASTQVSDADVVQLLKGAYREPVSFTGEWRSTYFSKGRTPDRDVTRAITRKVCADGGRDKHGPRQVAVCSSLHDAGHVESGLVDLWLILDARKPGERARIGTRLRDIQTGSHGSPGDVRLMDIGPSRTAFVLSSGYANMGWLKVSQEIFHAEAFKYERLLTVDTTISNGGVCDPKESAKCRQEHISLECKLRTDTSRVEGGFYALALDVSGERAGKPVKRTIAIPRATGAYAVPDEKTLARDACGQGF